MKLVKLLVSLSRVTPSHCSSSKQLIHVGDQKGWVRLSGMKPPHFSLSHANEAL